MNFPCKNTWNSQSTTQTNSSWDTDGYTVNAAACHFNEFQAIKFWIYFSYHFNRDLSERQYELFFLHNIFFSMLLYTRQETSDSHISYELSVSLLLHTQKHTLTQQGFHHQQTNWNAT